MHILILGNGFDIAHDLPTKYSDFLNYCRKEEKCKDFCFNNIWIKHFLNKTLPNENWIDFEEEIFNVISKLNTLPYFAPNMWRVEYEDIVFWMSKSCYNFNLDTCKKFFRKPEGFSTADCYYVPVKKFIPFLYNQLQDFIKEFEKYLNEQVLQNAKCATKYNLRISNQCVSLLNFNYTNTCEQLYKINFTHNDSGIKTKAVYIHGKINCKDKCNLVLGTHSFDNTQISTKFNAFKKHNQRHKYNTIESYQDLLNELKYPKKIYTTVFHVVGHSLDRTDHNILKHIFLAREKSIINIYYHDEESQEKLINNITKIIGEEEVMSKVRFIDQHDPKRGILIPVEEG